MACIAPLASEFLLAGALASVGYAFGKRKRDSSSEQLAVEVKSLKVDCCGQIVSLVSQLTGQIQELEGKLQQLAGQNGEFQQQAGASNTRKGHIANAVGTLLQRVDGVEARSPTLMDLAEAPYLLIATHLDAATLCQADTACRSLRELNRAHGGPWCALGFRTFFGLELDGDSVFEPTEGRGDEVAPCMSRKQVWVDWKSRYACFLAEILMFRAPASLPRFSCAEVLMFQQPHKIAYSQCRVRTDLLSEVPTSSVYFEMDVRASPDDVSLAIVDFEDGGCSSVTFSPGTGAVFRERTVCELPQKCHGSYIQPLSTITHSQVLQGSLGMYLKGGHIAFFRRYATAGETEKEPEFGPWESTGFVTDLAWSEGKRLTLCLSLWNDVQYCASAVCVGSQPPLALERNGVVYDEASWSSFNWGTDQM